MATTTPSNENKPAIKVTLKQWLSQAPFTLSLSSGYFGFFAHLGMLKALHEANLTPQRYTGASAGALVAGLSAAGCDVDTLKNRLFEINKADFWDPCWHLGLFLGRGLNGGLLKGHDFRAMIAELAPVTRIEDCPTPLTLSTYDIAAKKTQVFTQGDLSSLIYASCALPLLFQPIKYNNRWLSDGGIKDRPALASIIENERVLYHHIASVSPWRKKNSPALQLPEKNNLVGIAIEGLPRSGPNKLDNGKIAYKMAYQTMQHLLEQPIQQRYRVNAVE
jgi:NTE family protein